MTEKAAGLETTAPEPSRRRVRRKRRRQRRPRLRDRLRAAFASDALFYLLALAVVAGVVALFVAAVGDTG